jgi:hypothetical protein
MNSKDKLSGPMFAPSNNKTFTNFLPKKMNKDKFMDEDLIFELTLTDYRIITYFEVMKQKKTKLEYGEENQEIKLSYTELKHRFPSKKSFYDSIANLIRLDIINKVDDKAAVYRFNPLFISNLTTQQSVAMGIEKPNSFNKNLT